MLIDRRADRRPGVARQRVGRREREDPEARVDMVGDRLAQPVVGTGFWNSATSY